MPFVRINLEGLRRLVLCGFVLGLCGPVFAEGEQEKERPGITVPQEHAKLGRVYYLVESKKPQVTFRSSTSKEKFKGTSLQLIGYAVAPNDGEVLPAKLAAAEFRLPVVSLDTGNSQMNDHMLAKRWLNEDAYSHVAFTITDVQDVKVVKEREDSTLYKAKLVGTMSLVGQEKEMTVSARITLKPESEKTKKIAPGDLMTIRASFNIVLSEFGLGIDDPAIERKSIAKKIKVDVNLTLSTVQPKQTS